MTDESLTRQMDFLLEIDRLKAVVRQCYHLHSEKKENSAEHSWHVALAALLLAEHADERFDVDRVIKMLLVHDIVEIDAGDTYIYDEQAAKDKDEREQRAAERIFGLLSDDQRDHLMDLWEEYEARETPEARFAYAVDRLMPFLHNYHTQGRSWREHGVTSTQILAVMSSVEAGSRRLWAYTQSLVADAVARGYLPE